MFCLLSVLVSFKGCWKLKLRSKSFLWSTIAKFGFKLVKVFIKDAAASSTCLRATLATLRYITEQKNGQFLPVIGTLNTV